jgi:hypothetical protein
MAKRIPLQPKHPERICWGCDRYCSVDSMGCGNGTERTPHPMELFGEDWFKDDPNLVAENRDKDDKTSA